jgi:hypothetical protein
MKLSNEELKKNNIELQKYKALVGQLYSDGIIDENGDTHRLD